MKKLRELILRFGGLFNRQHKDRELNEEIEIHLQMHIEDNLRQGMTPQEARRQALIKLGGIESTKEAYRDQRGLPWLETLWQDIRFGGRMLRKSPEFTAIVVFTLALGIGATTVIFSLINGVLLKPLPYPESDRLVALFENHQAQGQDFVQITAPGFTDWRNQSTTFEGLAAYQAGGFDLTGVGDPARLLGVRVSANLFPLLRAQPMVGRGFTLEEDRYGGDRVVILAHKLWQERFGGSRDALGQSMTLDGVIYSIIGVMPPEFRFAGIATDIWLPMAFQPFEMENRGGHNYQAIGRLKPGVMLSQASQEMNVIAESLSNQHQLSRGWGVTLLPLQEQIVGGSTQPLYILFGAVLFVLLIACLNVANLLLARATTRTREFAIRAALGAGRLAIMRQLIVEGLLLAGLGAVGGWFLAHVSLGAVLQIGSTVLPRLEDVHLDRRAAVFAVIVTALTGIFFGLAPAWFSSRVSIDETLKDTSQRTTSRQGNRLRGSFVVLQLGLAVVLLIGATLMLRSFARIRALDPGYKPDHILTASLTMPDARFPGNDAREREALRKAFLARVVERAATLPGVESAASVMGMPLTIIGANSQVFVLGRPEPKPGEAQAAGYSQVSTNYFQTMGIPLLRGRHFDAFDTVDAPFVAIVNEAFARTFFQNQNPIGQRLRVMDSYRDRPTEIVGIIRDTRQRGVTANPEPEMYFPVKQRCWANGQLVIRTKGDPATLIPALTKAVAELDSQQTLYFVRTLTSLMDDSVAQQRLQMILLSVFSAVALLLAIVGVYGVMSCVVVQRWHEIGVRMSLGARGSQTLAMILWQGLRLSCVGISLGLAAAFGLCQLLRGLLFSISPTDPLTFIIAPCVLGFAALVGAWLPARRAAKVNPMVALRCE